MKPMTILLIVLAVALIAALVLYFYFFFFISLPNPRLPAQTLKIGDASFSVEIANTTTTRARGLSGRDPLGENEGMLFVFNSPGRYGFWMKDMKFALDFVWINGNRVAGVTENVPPPAPGASLFSLPVYYPPDLADKILEVNAGEAQKYGIHAGQEAILDE